MWRRECGDENVDTGRNREYGRVELGTHHLSRLYQTRRAAPSGSHKKPLRIVVKTCIQGAILTTKKKQLEGRSYQFPFPPKF